MIKVDRVNSVNEAENLQKIGCDFISISLDKSKFFNDDRYVSLDEALKIRMTLSKSKLVLEMTAEEADVSIIEKIQPDYIQFSEYDLPSKEFVEKLISLKFKLIGAGINVSYEDSPSWILSGYDDMKKNNLSFFQVDLLGDVENSWHFMTTESPLYPDEIQIGDINELANKYPFFITLDFNHNNIKNIMDTFTSVKGLSFVLGDSPSRNDIHCFNYEETVSLIKQINGL